MSLYEALKAAVPVLNSLPSETYASLVKMAGELPPEARRSLNGIVNSGLSDDEMKKLTASVIRVNNKHRELLSI